MWLLARFFFGGHGKCVGKCVAHLAVLITSKEAKVNSKRFAKQCWGHPFSRIWARTCFLTNYTWSLRVLCCGAFLITRFSMRWSCNLQQAPSNIWPSFVCVAFLESPNESSFWFRNLSDGGALSYLFIGFGNYMGLGLLVLSILCLIARCCWRPSRYKCVDHALNVLAAVFLYFVLLGVLVWQNPVTVIESALVRPIMRSRPRFILSIGFLQVLFFLTNDSTWRVSAYWSGILNLLKVLKTF